MSVQRKEGTVVLPRMFELTPEGAELLRDQYGHRWRRSFAVFALTSEGEVYLPALLFGRQTYWSSGRGQVPVTHFRNVRLAPASWLKQELPKHADEIDRICSLVVSDAAVQQKEAFQRETVTIPTKEEQADREARSGAEFHDKEELNNRWRDFFRQLSEMGIAKATCEFDGVSGFGYTAAFSFENPKVDYFTGDDENGNLFQDLVYETLDIYRADWRWEEGSFGEVTVDVQGKGIEIQYCRRIESLEGEDFSMKV